MSKIPSIVTFTTLNEKQDLKYVVCHENFAQIQLNLATETDSYINLPFIYSSIIRYTQRYFYPEFKVGLVVPDWVSFVAICT